MLPTRSPSNPPRPSQWSSTLRSHRSDPIAPISSLNNNPRTFRDIMNMPVFCDKRYTQRELPPQQHPSPHWTLRLETLSWRHSGGPSPWPCRQTRLTRFVKHGNYVGPTLQPSFLSKRLVILPTGCGTKPCTRARITTNGHLDLPVEPSPFCAYLCTVWQ